MIRPLKVRRGRLSVADRVLAIVCDRPGITSSEIGVLLDMDPRKGVHQALTSLHHGKDGQRLVDRSIRDGQRHWWATAAGCARMLEARRAFEEATSALEGAR